VSRAFNASANNPSHHNLDAAEDLLSTAAAAIRQLRGNKSHGRSLYALWLRRLCVSATNWLHIVRRGVARIPTESIAAGKHHIHLVGCPRRASTNVDPKPTTAQLRYVRQLAFAGREVIDNPTKGKLFALFLEVLATTLDELRREAKL
jgi:hypothetical protein